MLNLPEISTDLAFELRCVRRSPVARPGGPVCQEGGVPLRVMEPSREATEALHHTAWVTYSVALLCGLGFAYAQLSRVEADTVIDAGPERAEQSVTHPPDPQPPRILPLRLPS